MKAPGELSVKRAVLHQNVVGAGGQESEIKRRLQRGWPPDENRANQYRRIGKDHVAGCVLGAGRADQADACLLSKTGTKHADRHWADVARLIRADREDLEVELLDGDREWLSGPGRLLAIDEQVIGAGMRSGQNATVAACFVGSNASWS